MIDFFSGDLFTLTSCMWFGLLQHRFYSSEYAYLEYTHKYGHISYDPHLIIYKNPKNTANTMRTSSQVYHCDYSE